MKVTNNAASLQGVRTQRGLVYLKPGETRDLDFTTQGEKQARRLPFLAFDGKKAAEGEKESADERPSFEAKHRGGGSYSVVDAQGNEVVEKLSKEDAESFNAMPAAERAEYVEASKK